MAPIKQSVALEDIKIRMGGNTVGGAQSLDINLTQENKPIYEGGSKKPREIKDGLMAYTGTIERLFLDVDSIKDFSDLNNGDNPYFDIIATTKNKNPERKVTITDAKLKGFKLNFAMGEETKITQEFDALDADMS